MAYCRREVQLIILFSVLSVLILAGNNWHCQAVCKNANWQSIVECIESMPVLKVDPVKHS